MFTKETYLSRRDRLKKAVGDGLILLLGNDNCGMNYADNEYYFRQDSTLLYYTGIDQPGLVFIIDVDADRETLFGTDITVEEMVWSGPVNTLKNASLQAGIACFEPSEAVSVKLSDALKKGRKVHFLPPYRSEHVLKLSEWLTLNPRQLSDAASLPLIRAVIDQRSVKSTEEIAEIEKAVDVTADMQLAGMRLASPGKYEYSVAGQLMGIASSGGGYLSFPTIYTVTGQFLHIHSSKHLMHEGQMALCDCGAEVASHYAGDLTRTYPVGKHFTERQKTVYSIILEAHKTAIASIHPGKPYLEVHLAACEKLAQGLKELGLMKGDIKEAVREGAHALFFQCGIGHMLGLDVHDMENLGEKYVGYTDTLKKSTQFGLSALRLGRPLQNGFVVTVEPGLYFVPDLIDAWKAEGRLKDFINYDQVEAYKDFGGIRMEEDFVVTEDGSRRLGKPVALEIADVEAEKEKMLE